MTETNLGRIRPVSKGIWVPNVVYKDLDIVGFEGGSYIRTGEGTGSLSPKLDSNNWDLLASPGLTYRIKTLNWVGDLTTKIGNIKWYPEQDIIITSMIVYVNTASSVDIIVTLNKNGIPIESVVLVANSSKMSKLGLSFQALTSDYLTADITAIGGSDLTLTLSYE